MPRFFIEEGAAAPGVGDLYTVSGEDARHIASSLRMREGEKLTLCDGAGNDYLCSVVSVGRDVTARVLSVFPSRGEPPYRAAVYQALVKGDKFDSVVQKSVECGASSVTPFLSSRCVSRPDERSAGKKAERWRKIAAEAAMQCGRGALPEVGEAIPFSEAIKKAAAADIPLFCYEGGGEPLRDVLRGMRPGTVSVIIGPEGGFSPEEAAEAAAAGMKTVSLGARILRTETVAQTVLSCLSYEFEP